MAWFDVNKEGLSRIMERRGKAWALFELIQNAWDSGATVVEVTLEPVDGVPFVRGLNHGNFRLESSARLRAIAWGRIGSALRGLRTSGRSLLLPGMSDLRRTGEPGLLCGR